MLGEEHPSTLTLMSNLALSYSSFDRRQEEAVELGKKALEAGKRTLGEEHLRTLTFMVNLAISYYYIGRRQEAAELMEKSVEGRRRKLGEDHPDTRTSMEILATVLSAPNPSPEEPEQHVSS
jgi:tetratricopeptide (TPR) repeat protein